MAVSDDLLADAVATHLDPDADGRGDLARRLLHVLAYHADARRRVALPLAHMAGALGVPDAPLRSALALLEAQHLIVREGDRVQGRPQTWVVMPR